MRSTGTLAGMVKVARVLRSCRDEGGGLVDGGVEGLGFAGGGDLRGLDDAGGEGLRRRGGGRGDDEVEVEVGEGGFLQGEGGGAGEMLGGEVEEGVGAQVGGGFVFLGCGGR